MMILIWKYPNGINLNWYIIENGCDGIAWKKLVYASWNGF